MVWTGDDIHIEPIVFDTEPYDDLCLMVTKLHRSAIVPEVVGQVQLKTSCSRYHVLQDVQQTLQTDTSDICLEQMWCYCNQVESGQMVGCDM